MHSRTVFLDRDGVINEDSTEFVKSWSEFHFLPGSLEAIRRLSRHGCRIIVVTNQSAIGLGLTTLAELDRIHRNMRAAVAEKGGRIDGIYFCPHTKEDHCGCRKPNPGMIHAACRQHAIEVSTAVMVGDRTSDVACGRNAGCGFTVRVDGSVKESAPLDVTPDHHAKDLLEAAHWIISLPKGSPVSEK